MNEKGGQASFRRDIEKKPDPLLADFWLFAASQRKDTDS